MYLLYAVAPSKSGNGLQCQSPSGNVQKFKKIKFKMAETVCYMSGEEVLPQILAESSEETSDSDDILYVGNDEHADSKINGCLEALNGLNLGQNLEPFKKCVEKYIKASIEAFQPPSDPMKILLNKTVNCGTIFANESRQWLQKINARLSGRVSIRKPYQGKIVRNFPFEMFHALKTSVQHSRKGEITNNVVYSDNKKQQVMSFSSKKAVIVLLSVLSGYSEIEVKGFFKKVLTGRKHGKAHVIVSYGQEFCFTYKIKTGQFCVSFHYGTWNKAGFAVYNF